MNIANMAKQDVLIGAAVLIGAYLLLRNAKSVGSTIGGGAVDLVSGVLQGIDAALPEPIRPSSDQNVIYRGINAAGGAVTGQGESWTLGGWIYDVTRTDTSKAP